MATTLKLPYKRYVCQVSTGAPQSKASFLSMMQQNLDSLQACDWRKVDVPQATLSTHDFTAETQFSDAYDAFKLTGNYDNNAMTEIAYAGMAAYVFKMPDDGGNGRTLTNVFIPVFRDRFEKSGLHIAIEATGSSAQPAASWQAVRSGSGNPGFSQAGILAVPDAEYLVDSEGATVVVPFQISSSMPTAGDQYCIIYVSLEDYTDTWTKYNKKEPRQYAIEGSVMIDAANVEFTFEQNGLVAPSFSEPRQAMSLAYWMATSFDPGDVEIAYQSYEVPDGFPEVPPAFGLYYSSAMLAALRYVQYQISTCKCVVTRPLSSPPYEPLNCSASFSLTFKGNRSGLIRVSYSAVPVAFRFFVPQWMKNRAIKLESANMMYVNHAPFNHNDCLIGTPRLHVWCADGQSLQVVPESIVGDRRFSYPMVGTPPGWTYCGNMVDFLDRYNLVSMTLPLKLSKDVATIIFMPMVDILNLEGDAELRALVPYSSRDWPTDTVLTASIELKGHEGAWDQEGLVLSTV